MSDRYIDYDKLQIERPADGILKITFNKPERLNSVDSQTHSQLTEIWRDIDADSTVRAVLVTGAGKAFSAGGDFDLIEEIIDGQIYEVAFDGTDSDAEVLEKSTGLTILGDAMTEYDEPQSCIVSGKMTSRRQHLARMY